MDDFLTALALLFVIEGALYALIPETMRKMLVQMLELPEQRLRAFGVAFAVVGVIGVWLVRS
jgi:hypothetical protein